VLDKAHQKALVAIVGPDAVIVDAADRAAYETPARYAGGTAAAVVRPAFPSCRKAPTPAWPAVRRPTPARPRSCCRWIA
jgi:hypothetical protein